MMRIVSTPARIASGLPPKVVPWLPGPSMLAAFGPQTTAPTGTPEPRPLASGITSGSMPAHWCANHLPVRPMPHCTSSSISSQSRSSQSLRSCCRYSTRDGLMPPSPWITSRNTATTFGCVRRALRDRRDVVQRHAHEAFDQRAEAGLHLRVAGGRQRGDRAAVEGLLVDDDLRRARCPCRGRTCARSSARASLASRPVLQKNALVSPDSSHSLAASCSCSGTW